LSRILTVFAGPNGSGKSTLVKAENRIFIPDLYINADDIKQQRNISDLDAAILAEKLRNQALDLEISFSFETVLSTRRNLELMQRARNKSYHINVIYVITQNSTINIERVKDRVLLGGHSVPEEKIVTRYRRCIELLPEVVNVAHIMVLYNNSFSSPKLLLRKHNDTFIEIFEQPSPSKWTYAKIVEICGLQQQQPEDPLSKSNVSQPSNRSTRQTHENNF